MNNHVCLWEWDAANNEWVKKPAVVVADRRVGTGLIAGGAHKLYWVKCNPSAGNSVWEIADSAVALGAVLLDCFHTSKEGHITNFLPPCPFTNGIYLETFTNMTSMVFGYI